MEAKQKKIETLDEKMLRKKRNQIKVKILTFFEILSILSIPLGIICAIVPIGFKTLPLFLIIGGLLFWNIFDVIMDIIVDDDDLPKSKQLQNALDEEKLKAGIKLKSWEDA